MSELLAVWISRTMPATLSTMPSKAVPRRPSSSAPRWFERAVRSPLAARSLALASASTGRRIERMVKTASPVASARPSRPASRPRVRARDAASLARATSAARSAFTRPAILRAPASGTRTRPSAFSRAASAAAWSPRCTDGTSRSRTVLSCSSSAVLAEVAIRPITGSPIASTAFAPASPIRVPCSNASRYFSSPVATYIACDVICCWMPSIWWAAPAVAAFQRSVCFHADWACPL